MTHIKSVFFCSVKTETLADTKQNAYHRLIKVYVTVAKTECCKDGNDPAEVT
jgi:hypothetical protein